MGLVPAEFTWDSVGMLFFHLTHVTQMTQVIKFTSTELLAAPKGLSAPVTHHLLMPMGNTIGDADDCCNNWSCVFANDNVRTSFCPREQSLGATFGCLARFTHHNQPLIHLFLQT